MKYEDLSMNFSEKENKGSKKIFQISFLVLFLIVMHSLGVRALPYQGLVLGSMVIFLLLVSDVNLDAESVLFFIFLALVINAFSFRGIPSIEKLGNLNLILLMVFLYLRRFGKYFERDIFRISWAISMHGVASFAIFKLVPSLFSFSNLGGVDYGRFFVFLVTADTFQSGVRASGLCWEPGVFQLLANLCLFLGIKNSRNKWLLIGPFFAVLSSYSTAGIFVLACNMAYYVFKQRISVWKLVPGMLILVVIFLGFQEEFLENILEKFDGKNTSGLIRARDFSTGIELISQKPLIGHGIFDLDYLIDKGEVLLIDYEYLGSDFMNENGIFAGGYTNGFMLPLAAYGIPVGLLMYWAFLNNSIISGGRSEKAFLFLIFVLATISEPITLTSFYFCFVGSGAYVLIKEIFSEK